MELSYPSRPITSSTRLVSLDVIRGFAILGIVLLNVYAFALPIEFSYSLTWNEGRYSSADLWRYQLDNLLFRGRFLSLFALLFGVSLYLLVQRCQQSLQRRLKWLMLIGAAHGLFWWFGDILFCYGLTGWLLLRQGYLQTSVERQWQLGHRFFLLSLLVPTLGVIYTLLDPAGSMDEAVTATMIAQQQALWTGPYWPQVQQQAAIFFYSSLGYLLTIGWGVAALMLYGMALYRSGWFSQGFSSAKTCGLFVGGLLLSLMSGAIQHVTDYKYSVLEANPLALVGLVLMALSYGSVLIRLSNYFGASRGWLAVLAGCGRLAFSLYLLQSFVLVLLFRFIQPSWFAALDLVQLTAIAVLMIVLQLVLSQLYLKVYQQGPLEYLWRRLSRLPASQ